MKDYKEFQFGCIIFVFVVPLQILIAYFYLNDIGNPPMEMVDFLVINSILIITCLLFYGLTIKITGDAMKVSFGVGLISKTIQLNRIKTIETVFEAISQTRIADFEVRKTGHRTTIHRQHPFHFMRFTFWYDG